MAAKRTRKLLVWVLCLHTLWVTGQTTFQKTLGGPGQESATYVVETADGFVIAGHTTNAGGNQDALLVRLDAAGSPVWQKRFGGSQADLFQFVISTPDGGFLAAGETRSFGAGNADAYVIKTDGAGNTQWARTIGANGFNEQIRSIVAIPGGGFILSGISTPEGSTSSSSVFIRLDQNGNSLWSRTYNSEVSNLLQSQYIQGNTIYASGGLDHEAALVQLDLGTGGIIGKTHFAGSGTEALYYQQPTQDGNLIMCDHTWSANTGTDIEVWVQKIKPSNGQVMWSKVYYRNNDNIRGRIERVNDGGFLLTPYDNFNTPQADALLAKIDANGNLLWSYNYGGNAADRLFKALQTADGGFIAVGDTRSGTANGNSEILIIKTDAQGRVEGFCPRDGGIQAANYSANPGVPVLEAGKWLSSVSLNNNPLPISLVGGNFQTNISPVVFQTIPLCPNVSHTINGVAHFAPKLVLDTVSSLSGCDTIYNYNLTLLPFNTGVHVIGLCAGETYEIDGIHYSAPATVLDTVPSLTGGCDTLCTYVLKMWAQPTLSQNIAFCEGESVIIGGQAYNQPGTVEALIPSTTGGCDTLITYTLAQIPTPTRSTTIQFCPGESVMIGGVTYTQSETVTQTIPAVTTGCDTLVTYHLELLTQPTRSENIRFCPGESVTIGGQTYSQSATVVANIPSATGGCDTIVTYTLELLSQPTRAETRSFCPGESVTIAGQTYTQPGTVLANLASTTGGCDTIVTYTLELLSQPARAETRSFCPGESVTIAGQAYTQPGTVVANLASTTGGCDTIVTYTLELLSQPARAETRSFCPGETVTIAGQTYTQPGTVVANVASTTGGCDTIVTYTLELLSQPARAEVRGFCPGETVTIAGQTYTQPGTVVASVASTTGGCDTIVTYQLQYLTPAPSNVSIHCPQDVTVITAPGGGAITANYADPQAASDCVCPGLELNRTAGPASGSVFPVGTTQVCYQMKDACGQEMPCCFNVTVREEQPCDVKTIGCMKYELLSVTKDAAKNHTYRIRVTNNCSNKLIYTAIQVPDGVTAMQPLNNSTYQAPDGRSYLVRSPNYSPMYSIRFKSTTDSIANGQSDIFEYTLPAQSNNVTYINITSRLANQVFYEAHLNTFYCPVGTTPDNVQRASVMREEGDVEVQNSVLLFPNPTTGVLYADISDWLGQKLAIQVVNSQGQQVHTLHVTAEEEVLRVELPQGLSAGVYFFEVTNEKGQKETLRFVFQR
jgi:Tfp pilus assembly major pilin PilA